jgi:hypothetical protein
MAGTSLIFEDILDGASNFFPWKVKVTLLLEKSGSMIFLALRSRTYRENNR